MGRPVGHKEPSIEAAALLETIKRNLRKRLDELGVTPSIVGVRTGRPPSWLADVVGTGRYSRKVSSEMIADFAEALGVHPSDLLDADYDGKGGVVPRWLEDSPPRSREATS